MTRRMVRCFQGQQILRRRRAKKGIVLRGGVPMIGIKSSIINAVNRAVTPQDHYPALQMAVELELSTIRP